MKPENELSKKEFRSFFKEPKKTKKGSKTEAPVQAALNYYLDLKGIDYFRIPDELFTFLIYHLEKAIREHRVSEEIKIKKLLKTLKGWPDNMVHIPLTEKYLLSCPIECKSDKGKMHGEQKNKGRRLNYQIPRSEKEAIGIVERFLADFDSIENILNKELQ